MISADVFISLDQGGKVTSNVFGSTTAYLVNVLFGDGSKSQKGDVIRNNEDGTKKVKEKCLTIKEITSFRKAIQSLAVFLVRIGSDSHLALVEDLLANLFMEGLAGSSGTKSTNECTIDLFRWSQMSRWRRDRPESSAYHGGLFRAIQATKNRDFRAICPVNLGFSHAHRLHETSVAHQTINLIHSNQNRVSEEEKRINIRFKR